LVTVADLAHIRKVGSLREWTGSLGKFPAWSGASTAGGLISTAAGIGQITHSTFNDYKEQFGISDFQPESQISFIWKLAASRFNQLARKDLLTTLQAGQTELIHTYLVKTWPGGCDAKFPKRYANNLAALRQAEPATASPAYALTISSQVDPATQKVEQSYALADEKGATLPLAIKVMVLAASMAIPFLGMFLLGGCDEHVGVRHKQIALAPGEKPKSAFEAAKPTFRMVPGPRGPLAVPVGGRR
jgi:hypothetical protein